MFTEKQVIALARSVLQAWEQADSLLASVPDSTEQGGARQEAEGLLQVLEDLQGRIYALGSRAAAEDTREAELRRLLNSLLDLAVLARLRELMQDARLRDMARQIVALRIPGVRAGMDWEVVADSVARARAKPGEAAQGRLRMERLSTHMDQYHGLGPQRRRCVNGRHEALDGRPCKPGMCRPLPSNSARRALTAAQCTQKMDRPGVVSPAVQACGLALTSRGEEYPIMGTNHGGNQPWRKRPRSVPLPPSGP